MSQTLQTPICPGCHFGCALDAFQCARGERFLGKWRAGEEIPKRRPPWDRGGGKPAPEGGGPVADAAAPGKHTPPPRLAALPASARVMMLLTGFQNMFRDRDEAERDRRVAECILRQDGAAANPIIVERTRLSDGEIDEQVAKLGDRGLVADRVLEDGRVLHELTETGRDQAKVWLEEHGQAEAEFFSALDEDEVVQLEALLAKAFEANMRKRR